MYTIKRVSELSFQEATALWNRGFEGYFIPVNTDVSAFIQRMAYEGLSPDHSVVAFHDDQPVGFVMNGFRTVNGKKIAWNGGTGVIPEYRRQGVGKMLMKATLDVYREEQVELALLEAISANTKAIQLYQQMGYEIIDELFFYIKQGPLEGAKQSLPEGYSYQKGIPHDVRTLEFYRADAAWQTQWASVHDGEALIVRDQTGQEVAYAIYKRAFDAEGKTTGVNLYQAEVVQPEHERSQMIMEALLLEVYSPLDQSCQRGTVNFPLSNQLATEILRKWGFTARAEQVFMTKQMD